MTRRGRPYLHYNYLWASSWLFPSAARCLWWRLKGQTAVTCSLGEAILIGEREGRDGFWQTLRKLQLASRGRRVIAPISGFRRSGMVTKNFKTFECPASLTPLLKQHNRLLTVKRIKTDQASTPNAGREIEGYIPEVAQTHPLSGFGASILTPL